jgi:hypothetical protein
MLNPITPHGAVVVNAAYDYAHYTKASTGRDGDGDMANHRIEKKDLVFCDTILSKRKRSSYNEPDLHVIATTNGVPEERRKCGGFSFIGVSNAHIDANSHRHAAVTVAGLTSIRNTGPVRIEAGDKVVWGLADHKATGPNKRRKVFRTFPYHMAFEGNANSHFDEVLEVLKGEEGSGAAKMCAKLLTEALPGADSEMFEKMKNFLQCYVREVSQINSRVVGTALSKAEEGDDFDILIRHSHV